MKGAHDVARPGWVPTDLAALEVKGHAGSPELETLHPPPRRLAGPPTSPGREEGGTHDVLGQRRGLGCPISTCC